MIWKQLVIIVVGLIAGGGYIPYARDIIRGTVRPARSARLMLTLLIIVALLQQRSLGAGPTLAVTIGETIGSVAILILALKKGIGGFRRLDLICYGLLALDLGFWFVTNNPALSLVLTIIADCVAFFPTVHKTWQNPGSETVLFFGIGAVTPLLNLLVAGHLTFAIALYPLSLALENGLEVALMYRSTK